MKIKCLKDEEIGFSNASSVELKSNYFLKYYILIIQKNLKQNIANIFNCIAFFFVSPIEEYTSLKLIGNRKISFQIKWSKGDFVICCF